MDGFIECPMCGSRPIWDPAWVDRKGKWHPASAMCPKCGTVINGVASYWHGGPPTQEDYDASLESVRREWNQRGA